MPAADAANGAQQFKKCTACHTINQGGAAGLGPNLWGIMGQPIAGQPGFAYSDALKAVGGTWTWDQMSAWIKSPRNFASGTKMTFAGISDPQDRADLLLYLNSQGSNLPIPAPPAVDTPAEVTAEEAGATADKAEDEPVLNETEAAAQPEGNIEGDAAPKTE